MPKAIGAYDPTLIDRPGAREAAEMARKLRSHLAQYGLEDAIFYGVGIIDLLPLHAAARWPDEQN